MSLAGHCKCGGIKVLTDGDPVGVAQCWCRQCQSIMNGGPVNCAVFLTDAIHIIGELTSSTYTADSGAQCERSFCAHCMAPIMGQSTSVPQFRSVHIDLFCDGHGLKPAVALWTQEAPDDAVIDPALKHIARQ